MTQTGTLYLNQRRTVLACKCLRVANIIVGGKPMCAACFKALAIPLKKEATP